ncbi:MAG: class I SAM-dependent methyltransferase, partial [Methanomassiliicoccales archaeon]|nr:class I SAM-dependent methyltransferase [Methanomassiliicoccales archaeon]
MLGTINKRLFRYFFDSSYRRAPAWEIGHPQPEIVELERRNEIQGSILDLGCGTGENALFLAEGHQDVLGIDYSPRAIEQAISKGKARESKARFEVMDALEVGSLGRRFDTIIDSTLLPNIAKRDRHGYL